MAYVLVVPPETPRELIPMIQACYEDRKVSADQYWRFFVWFFWNPDAILEVGRWIPPDPGGVSVFLSGRLSQVEINKILMDHEEALDEMYEYRFNRQTAH